MFPPSHVFTENLRSKAVNNSGKTMKTSWQNNISLFKLAINDGIENCITHTAHTQNT